MEFQSWKVNFKTDVCSKSADFHLTIHWIREDEIAKSSDELVTSRSIMERTDFSDYDMLDAMIASALKRLLDEHIHFRKRESVEERRAQKYDRFLRGRHITYMKQSKDSQICSMYACRMTKSKISTFDVRS